MPVLRLGNQHPRHEGTQCQRQPSLFGNVGQAQRHQQHVEHKEFGGLAQCHDMEPAAHPLLPDKQHHPQHHRRLEKRDTDLNRHVGGRLPQRGDHNQQGHDQQILRQQHTHHFAAMRCLQFTSLYQELGEHGGGRHGNGTAKSQARLPVQSERHGDTRDNRHGDQHLRHTEPEHRLAHGVEPRQRKLQPDREHQEYHAEFGQGVGGLDVFQQRQGVGTNQQPDQQIAEHGRHIDPAHQDHAKHRGHQQQQDQGKR